MTTPMIINLADLVADPSLQPRVAGLDAEHAHALQDVYESCPPLVVVQRDGRFILIDGFHRLAAAQNLGLATVPVTVVPLPDDGDLHALTFALNAAHGSPLSLADRRAFAQRLLRQHSDWADREIGRRCGVSSNTVGSIREALARAAQIEQPDTRVGAGGYLYTVGTNPKQRQPGELPDVRLGEQLAEVVGRLFTPADRKRQRAVAHYLQRLAIALDDRLDMGGWDGPREVADAVRLVLSDERAAALGERLGQASAQIYDVALALGYREEGDEP